MIGQIGPWRKIFFLDWPGINKRHQWFVRAIPVPFTGKDWCVCILKREKKEKAEQ